MDTPDTSIKDQKPVETVRLKVRGASAVVNTIQEQKTASGLSLICPFPALEVDIPIHYNPTSSRRDAKMFGGTIHRIGVEDDPVTGLPRLRLSIRTDHRSTVVTDTPHALIEQTEKGHSAPPEPASAEPIVWAKVTAGSGIEGEEDEEELKDTTDETLKAVDRPAAPRPIRRPGAEEEPFALSRLEEADDEDPAWVDCSDLPSPAQIMEQARSGRKKRITHAIAWGLVIGLLSAGGYVLYKSGLVDTSAVRNLIADVASGGEATSPALPGEQPAENSGTPLTEASIRELYAPTSPSPEVVEPPADAPATETAAETVPAPEAASEAPAEEPADIEESGDKSTAVADGELPQAAPEPSATPELSVEDVTLILPTRWPVEYATAYRLREPQGVVVDVPGGLVKREGWLDLQLQHPMVRSVKAIQRETGARFMVRINGKAPRFMTSPKTGGVALRLFREPDPSAKTEQIALLDQ